jgi:4-amino-4-deoxy-L-arabinose transferase-like glycosyltransferase
MNINRTKLLLLVILVLSAALRLYHLGDKPIWFDEASSISHSEQPFEAYLFSPRVNYKPVFFFLLNLWLKMFGEGPEAMRMFPVIWGVLCVLLIYKVGKAVFGKRTGLISAFLLSISVFHIFQSQQLRHFSFLTFLTLGSVFCLLQCLQKGKRQWFVLLTLVNVLAIFTHPYGICVPFFEAGYLLFAERIYGGRRWLISFGTAGVFFIIWLLIPNKAHIKELIWWISPPGWRDFFEVATTMSFGGSRYGLDDFRIWGGSRYWMPFSPAHRNIFYLSLVLTASYAFLFIKGIFARKEGQGARYTVLLLFWFFFPVAAAALLSYSGTLQAFSIKHMIIALPAFLILIARGIEACSPGLKKASILLITLITIFPLNLMYNNYFGVDWKSGAQMVKSGARPGDAVVIYSLMEVVPFMYYFRAHAPSLAGIDIYGQRQGSVYRDAFVDESSGVLIVGIKQKEFGDNRISAERHFASQVNRNRIEDCAHVWVMTSRWTDPRVCRMMQAYFEERFPKMECADMQGLTVCRYSR